MNKQFTLSWYRDNSDDPYRSRTQGSWSEILIERATAGVIVHHVKMLRGFAHKTGHPEIATGRDLINLIEKKYGARDTNSCFAHLVEWWNKLIAEEQKEKSNYLYEFEAAFHKQCKAAGLEGETTTGLWTNAHMSYGKGESAEVGAAKWFEHYKGYLKKIS